MLLEPGWQGDSVRHLIATKLVVADDQLFWGNYHDLLVLFVLFLVIQKRSDSPPNSTRLFENKSTKLLIEYNHQGQFDIWKFCILIENWSILHKKIIFVNLYWFFQFIVSFKVIWEVFAQILKPNILNAHKMGTLNAPTIIHKGVYVLTTPLERYLSSI